MFSAVLLSPCSCLLGPIAILSLIMPTSLAAQTSVNGPTPGQCIFSTKVMPKGKFSDPAYRLVKDLFKPGEPIAARCFYTDGQQANYAKLGRIANSMRDSGKYYVELEWTKPDGASGSHSDFRISAFNHNYRQDWDQQRYDLTSDYAECDFKLKGDDKRKYGVKSDGCMDFVRFTERQSKRVRVASPAQSEFCIRVFMKFANTRSLRTVGGQVREEPDYVEKTMSRGCFKVDMAGASATSVGGVDVATLHRVALQNRDKACRAQAVPGREEQLCSCVKKSVIEGGLADYSPEAVSLYAMTSLNPQAFSNEERMAALQAASQDQRTEAASSDLAQLGGGAMISCLSNRF